MGFDLGRKYSLPGKFSRGLLVVSLLMLLISYSPFVVGGDLLEPPLVVRAQTHRVLYATLAHLYQTEPPDAQNL